MAKNRKPTPPAIELPDLSDVDFEKMMSSELDMWETADPSDQAFWEEFFKIEDALSMTDELDPPHFSITIQNHQTGEVKTYHNVHLRSARKKVNC